jgi:hypothetical protein
MSTYAEQRSRTFTSIAAVVQHHSKIHNDANNLQAPANDGVVEGYDPEEIGYYNDNEVVEDDNQNAEELPAAENHQQEVASVGYHNGIPVNFVPRLVEDNGNSKTVYGEKIIEFLERIYGKGCFSAKTLDEFVGYSRKVKRSKTDEMKVELLEFDALVKVSCVPCKETLLLSSVVLFFSHALIIVIICSFINRGEVE